MREMKETGISWFPLIPVDWQTGRIKDILSVLTDYTANGSFGDLAKNVTYLDYEDYARLVRLTDLRENLKNMGVYVDEDGYNYLSKSSLFGGEILVANVGAYAGLFCEMPTVDYPATLAPNMFLLRTNDVMLQHYLLYVGLSSFVWEQLCQKAISSAQPKLNKTDVKTTFIPIPPISEQKRIADYLDSKCAQFDSTIFDIQSQIEALEEYKRSVITEAVTKGLDPDVEMRDSGIAWVGDIPAHWITHPLYFYFGERKNKNALGLETNLLSLSYGKIIRKDINSNGGLLPESFNTYNIIEKDDIIIRPTDLQNDKRSLRTGIAREHGIITSAYIAMKAIKAVNPEYFHYLLHAYDVMKVFYNMGNGVRQGLNFSEFSRLMVFEPTIEEQNAIVAYLKEKCDEIDLAIAEKKQQIETIEEYKKSMIFEYVTGKKECPIIKYKTFDFIYYNNDKKYEHMLIECLNKSNKMKQIFGGEFKWNDDQSHGEPDATVKDSKKSIDFKLLISKDYMEFKRITSPIVTEIIPGVKITSMPEAKKARVLLLFNVLRNMSFERLEECRKSKKREDKSIVHFFDKLLNFDKNILLFNPLLFSTVDSSIPIDEQFNIILNEISEKTKFIFEYRTKTHPEYETYMIYGLDAKRIQEQKFILTKYTPQGLELIDIIKIHDLKEIEKTYYDEFF